VQIRTNTGTYICYAFISSHAQNSIAMLFGASCCQWCW